MKGNKKFRGNDIYYTKNGDACFSDTNKPLKDNWKNHPCGFCGLGFTSKGHDGCLGELPHVMNACCGHGNESDAYIQWWDGTCTRGEKALNKLEYLKHLRSKGMNTLHFLDYFKGIVANQLMNCSAYGNDFIIEDGIIQDDKATFRILLKNHVILVEATPDSMFFKVGKEYKQIDDLNYTVIQAIEESFKT